jgi:hypothetical protein
MRSVIAALVVGLLVLPSAADSATAAAGEPADPQLWPMPIPEQVGDIPTSPLDFYRWIVVERARQALRRVETSEDGLAYGASAEDANMAWVMASAYDGKGWSSLYRDEDLLRGAVRLMDAVTEVRSKEPWEKGQGHGPRFGLHAYANAVAFWKETGAIPPNTLERWVECVRKSADFAIRYDARALWVGEYANPEFYTLAGLAAAWQLTGEDRYRDEAARTLRRYEAQTFADGGVSYMTLMNAQTGYQHMIVKSVARYYEITQDPYARELLQRYARYYHLVPLAAGIHSPSEQPWLKHYLIGSINPAVPDMLASFTGDGRCATVARVQAFRTAEQIAGHFPSFRGQGPYAWYNFHHTTYAVLALRYHRPVEPEALPARWVGPDENLRGIRGRWDNWMAFATSRRASMTLAGCLIADPAEPFYPIGSGLLFFLAEYSEGAVQQQDAFGLPGNYFVLTDWEPVHFRSVRDGAAIVNVFSALSSPYWGTFPESSAESRFRNPGAWEYCQAWITWKNSLIGLVRMTAVRDSELSAGENTVRLRPVFFPQNRELSLDTDPDGAVRGSYGPLGFCMEPLSTTDGWAFGQTDNTASPPFFQGDTYVYVQPVSPVFEKTEGAWKRGDTVSLWTAYWDRGDPAFDVADARALRVRLLADRAGAVVVRESDRSVLVFAANLQRRWVELQLDCEDGWTIELTKNEHDLPVFPREPVRWSLAAFQTAILRVQSDQPINAEMVANRLRVTGGRWPWKLGIDPEPYPWSPPY